MHTAGWSSDVETFRNNRRRLSRIHQSCQDPVQLRFRQVRFEWAKARTLAKLKREWAEAVWAKKQATASELVVAVVDCESI